MFGLQIAFVLIDALTLSAKTAALFARVLRC